MHGHPFDLIDFLEYLRQQWLIFVLAPAIAMALAFGISVSQPKRYTATAQVLIQAPGGNDPRAATAISPVYLESLKAYENIASSDVVFARALDRVRPPEISLGRPVEALKRSMLKITKPASTAVLEIQATSRNPESAHSLAQNIAEQMVGLGRSVEDESRQELLSESRKQLADARTALDKARAAENAGAGEPVESLQNKLDSESDLEGRLATELALARADFAGYGQADASPETAREREAEVARIASLETQQVEVEKVIAADAARLEKNRSRREALESDAKSAQTAYDATSTRLNQLLASTAFQSERLRVIDPGIVPQSPSSPDTPLNMAAALILAVAGSFGYVAARFGRKNVTPHPITREMEYAGRR